MFVGVAGSSENTQGDRNIPDTFIGTECLDKKQEPIIGIKCLDHPHAGYECGHCSEHTTLRLPNEQPNGLGMFVGPQAGLCID